MTHPDEKKTSKVSRQKIDSETSSRMYSREWLRRHVEQTPDDGVDQVETESAAICALHCAEQKCTA
jgi:hypothetical protein